MAGGGNTPAFFLSAADSQAAVLQVPTYDNIQSCLCIRSRRTVFDESGKIKFLFDGNCDQLKCLKEISKLCKLRSATAENSQL